jgi:hypothetical protein
MNLKKYATAGTDPREYDNQCAAGAQHQAGGNGRDAPNTSDWERGNPVGPNTPPGTMIARGWVPDSSKNRGYKYPNQSNLNNTGVSNHTVIFVGMNPDGSINVRHQYRNGSTGEGCSVHESPDSPNGYYESWTPLGITGPKSTGTWGDPIK